MSEDAGDFLIGALLAVPYMTLLKRAEEASARAGFTDVGPAHVPVFQLLSPNGDRVTDLAKRAGITKQAMGYLVNHLVARGYLERAPDPLDGRASLIRRTQRGWRVNLNARRTVEEVQHEWTEQLGPRRMDHLLKLLRDLAHILGAQYEASQADLRVMQSRAMRSVRHSPIRRTSSRTRRPDI